MFNYVEGLFNKCHKVSLNCGGSCMDSSKRLKRQEMPNKFKKQWQFVKIWVMKQWQDMQK